MAQHNVLSVVARLQSVQPAVLTPNPVPVFTTPLWHSAVTTCKSESLV